MFAVRVLVTPLCVLAFGPKTAIGILLPLLCAGDAFSMWHYWRQWRAENMKFLLPGVVVGGVIGVQLIGQISPRQLNIAIGLIAVLFAGFQFAKDRIFRAEGAFAPNHRVGLPCGVGMGVTSTFAHGAGPVAAMFLIPQRLWHRVKLYAGARGKTSHYIRSNLNTLFRGLPFRPAMPVPQWLQIRVVVCGLPDGCLVDGHRLVEP